mmetsp:Transcript_5807/g.7842  ORF Transcript_5807/g.7842 Transcript_5807/m.7842 type:complete len:95 (+) Transcript_5807:29-313(+)|eukprot:CAMPEP_0185578212 /NCGR_PEP_ID=MMETSP0434-20130131/12326_1 /TAXON_ID=626734 ORGANISM="Favella taraikaensis, Strain Fe Narragansett Bay" /NCGR_SAMPLE_ID=MMETSP0434 /ASSEMBLY_ACC=CAM_ASM_000379 /LENGTH=94 /DNA_ID=CAMNT_0028195967 /DNA_START=15 /DNA_END=299 /DNA_ORIENTATION=-
MAEERQILNYKPVLQKFVEANEAFIDCMAAIPKESLADMSSAQIDSQCTREKSAIKSILDSNSMTMTQVVKDRINVMKTLKEVGVPIVQINEEQ